MNSFNNISYNTGGKFLFMPTTMQKEYSHTLGQSLFIDQMGLTLHKQITQYFVQSSLAAITPPFVLVLTHSFFFCPIAILGIPA